MADESNSATQHVLAIPSDDPLRKLATVRAEHRSENPPHWSSGGYLHDSLKCRKRLAGFVSSTCTFPPGGGPPPHRHDFEEAFILLEGELDVVFRGAKQVVRAGETIHVPANAPHQFHNSSTRPARMLCICSPAGQDEFFMEIGVPVATRTTPPPALVGAAQLEFKTKAAALAPTYRTELLQHG